MDAENMLKSELFKPIVATLAPGLLVLSPYFFVAMHFYPKLLSTLKDYENPSLAALFAIIVIAGYMLENIGSRIECMLWPTYATDEDLKGWYEYLLLKPDKEQVMIGYIDSIVLRMKLENSLVAASIIAWLGITWLYNLNEICSACEYWQTSFFLFFVFLYQIYESRSSGVLLRNLRKKLLTTSAGD